MTAAVAAVVATSVHPTMRRRDGEGATAAIDIATASPGAAAAITLAGSTPAAAPMAATAIIPTANANTAARVACTAALSPPPRTFRITTRTASVEATNSAVKGTATPKDVLIETPAARQI